MSERRRAEPVEIVAALAARLPDPADAAGVSRWMLSALSLPHVPVYKARPVLDRLGALGLTHPMAAYFAERAAPMGAVTAPVITAAFYGFSPQLVVRHVPQVWDVARPAVVLAATLEGMREFLTEVLADREEDLGHAASLLRPVAEAHEVAGRPLAAAWADVPWADEPSVDLWLAVTRIRESRGDGHVAVLVSEGVGPLASHLLTTGDVRAQRAGLAALRGWEEDEVAAQAEALRERGLLDGEGRRTDEARRLREHIEARTDACSSSTWAAAGPDAVRAIAAVALSLAGPLIASGAIVGSLLARLAPRATNG
jgi:hypothetical protein